jgi:hypothetical protein
LEARNPFSSKEKWFRITPPDVRRTSKEKWFRIVDKLAIVWYYVIALAR